MSSAAVSAVETSISVATVGKAEVLAVVDCLREALFRRADDPEMHSVALAASRACNPNAHIPVATTFDALFASPSSRDLALRRRANGFAPNSAPRLYRKNILPCPDKSRVNKGEGMRDFSATGRLGQSGRMVAHGPGHSTVRPQTVVVG